MAEHDVKIRLEDRYTADSGQVQMTGVQALARLPLNILRSDRTRGLKTAVFISGYEGSPLGGYDLELQRHAKLLAEYDLIFQPGVNEELAATSVQGSQLAAGLADARVEGVTGCWYGKSPGLDRASDALRHANLMGTHPKGGAVAFVGDDPAAKSSTVPGASEFLLADLGMPVLYPADPQDVLDLGVHAVAMSRLSGLWVALKIATNVADGSGTVEIGSDHVDPQLPLVMFEGQKFEHHLTARMLQPALSEMERTREGVRMAAARAYALANRLNRSETFGPRASSSGASSSGASSSGASIGIVAAGKTYLDMRQALRTLGLDEAELRARGVRLLRLAMIHPLIASEIEEFADGLTEIIVVEEKRPFIESAVKEILYGVKNAPTVTGKTDPAGARLFAAYGELDADLIAAGLAGTLGRFPEFTTVTAWQANQAKQAKQALGQRPVTQLPLVSRTPYFCSGCPHNSSTKVPEGSLVGGGIGCHALVLMMEPEAVGDVARAYPDGWRGSPVDRHGTVPAHSAAPVAEHRRRHLPSFRQPGGTSGGRQRRQRHLQAAVQLSGGHDRRPAGYRSDVDPGADQDADGRRGAAYRHHHRRAQALPASRPRADRRGLASRPGRRGSGGSQPGRGRHRSHSRPGVRDRASPQAQAAACG